ncbi:MAG: four helix bundle protein [Planctomycetota bacterium]
MRSWRSADRSSRAASTRAANIAEGCLLDTDALFVRHLRTAPGSAGELEC